MWMLVPEEDVSLVAYLIPKRVPTDNQIIGFNLSLPMGYINSAAYFCMKKNTIADLSNFTILEQHEDPPYHRIHNSTRREGRTNGSRRHHMFKPHDCTMRQGSHNFWISTYMTSSSSCRVSSVIITEWHDTFLLSLPCHNPHTPE